MSKLTLDFEWIDPAGARGPELRATWASLQISLDGNAVTRLIDEVSRSVRSHLFLPLYPVAEWLATHWWFLFHEVETPGRSTSEQYENRHNLRHGAEGFALPSLTIQPMGDQVRLIWQPVRLEAQNLEFTASGSVQVSESELRQTLSDFISAVLRRLQEQGVEETLLAREWNSILAADEEEREFCATVASLGIDPYTLDEKKQQEIIEVGESLPPSIWTDFFAVADFATLPQQARQVLAALKSSRRNRSNLESLKTLKMEMRAGARLQGSPWQQGYQFAHQLRDRLNLNGDRLSSFSALGKALGVQMKSAITQATSLPSSLNALVAMNSHESPVFAVPSRRDDAIRFAFCRALFEYLTTTEGQPLLLTTARSDRQKRNRAFAAEFLVPKDLLRKELSSHIVGDEEMDDLAAAFGVSPNVIRHQIENHELALSLPD
jgi:hypothetical protein